MVDLEHPPLTTGALDIVALADLRHRAPDLVGAPVRAACHVVMLVNAGHGRHGIDFVEYACRPSTLLWIRPGQVHQFGPQGRLDATLLLFTAEFLAPTGLLAGLVDDPFAPSNWLPTGEDQEAIITEVTQLATDRARHTAGDGVSSELLHHQLAVLLVRIAGLSRATSAYRPPSPLLRRLYRELARSFAVTRQVEVYAARLGVSVRTLTRASLTGTGRTAKQLVDARVALEAKRMLACTDAPVAMIGRRLGFTEPTNFGRFFVRETGVTPGEFRASVAG